MEKKILAISEEDFKNIVATAGQKYMSGADITLQAIMVMYKEEFVKFMGGLCTDIHKALFSKKYVIGTKGKTAEAECFNRRIKKQLILYYHKNKNLSRRN